MSKIVFFGTPSFSVPALRALAGSPFRPVAVVTAPDKPVGRRQILTPSPVALTAQELGIPVLKLATLRDDASWAQFQALEATLCVVVAYGKLIPKRFLEAAPKGWLNIHPSLLPQYRGPAPIQQAIIDGQSSTGVSIMLLDETEDTGPVIAQRPWTIAPLDATYAQCHDTLAQMGAELLLESLPSYLDGSLTPTAQDDTLATHSRKLTRADGKLDPSKSVTDLANLIRALADNPGTWLSVEGIDYNIFSAVAHTQPPTHPHGTLVAWQNGLALACSDGYLEILEIQKSGSTRQAITEFMRGNAHLAGQVVS
jgi:methionyl-tRNA formyltransferase